VSRFSKLRSLTTNQRSPKHLRQAGYRTAVFGKMHFNRQTHPGLHGFDSLVVDGDTLKAYAAQMKPEPPPEGVKVKPRWQPFKDPARIWLNAEKLPYGRYERDMTGTFIAAEGCRYLEENKNDPFALWISFHEPHSPTISRSSIATGSTRRASMCPASARKTPGRSAHLPRPQRCGKSAGSSPPITLR